MIVLLDTNSLLLPHQHGIDIFAEIERIFPQQHEVATLSTVLDELKGLSAMRNNDGIAAKVGLSLLTGKNVRVIPSSGIVDDAIVEFAAENKAVVCTNDKELKRKLKAKRVALLVMRGKNHLELR